MAVRHVERVVDTRTLCRTVWSLVVLVDRCELLVRLATCVDIRLLPCLFSFWVCGSGPAVGTRGRRGVPLLPGRSRARMRAICYMSTVTPSGNVNDGMNSLRMSVIHMSPAKSVMPSTSC